MYSQLVAALLQQKDGNGKNASPNISVENIFGGVQFLTPVYNKKNQLTDFSYAWLIMPRHAYSGNLVSGASFNEAGITVKQFQLLKKFIKVFITGEPLVYSISNINERQLLTLKVQKFDGGLLLWQENLNEQDTAQKINYQHALEVLPDLIYIIDAKDQRITYLNAAAKNHLENPEDSRSYSFSDFLHPDDNLQRKDNINSFISGAVTTTYESQILLKLKDGEYHLFELRERILLPDGDDVPQQIIGIGRKVTATDQHTSITGKVNEERDNTAGQKNDRSRFLESVAEATPDIVFLMDLNTKEVLYTNRSVPLLMGYTEEQASSMKHPIFDCVAPQDLPALMKHLDDFKTAKDGEVREIEYRLIDAKGGMHWYCDRNTVFRRDAAGMVSEKIGIAQEITKRKLLDSKVEGLNDALTFKNAELASANFDLNAFNTLAANHYKETLRNLYTSMEFIISNDAKSLSNEGRANLRRSQSAIQKMKLFTEDIVAFSGIKSSNSPAVTADLNLILQEVIQEQESRITSAQLHIRHDELPQITGYPDMITLLFAHLISNSIKFRNEAIAKAALEIKYEKKTCLNKVQQLQEMHCISFIDNGIGFNNEYANDIFTLFLQLNKDAKYRGSGIGLAVCKKIMDLHKGTISASGKAGEGAAITCCFPV